jgi:hypothetical protein
MLLCSKGRRKIRTFFLTLKTLDPDPYFKYVSGSRRQIFFADPDPKHYWMHFDEKNSGHFIFYTWDVYS